MVLRKRKSISLILALARDAAGHFWDSFDFSDWPVVTLDKVMVEIWSEQEGVEGYTEDNLERWKEFRSYVLGLRNVNLADSNGPLPTWNPSAARTGPSRFDRFLSVLGIDRVRVSYNSFHSTFLLVMYQGSKSNRNTLSGQQEW